MDDCSFVKIRNTFLSVLPYPSLKSWRRRSLPRCHKLFKEDFLIVELPSSKRCPTDQSHLMFYRWPGEQLAWFDSICASEKFMSKASSKRNDREDSKASPPQSPGQSVSSLPVASSRQQAVFSTSASSPSSCSSSRFPSSPEELPKNFVPPHSLTAEVLASVPLDEKGNLLSVGSVPHAEGNCKACVFFHNREKGCNNGVGCLFCHYEHPPKKRVRLPRKKKKVSPAIAPRSNNDSVNTPVYPRRQVRRPAGKPVIPPPPPLPALPQERSATMNAQSFYRTDSYEELGGSLPDVFNELLVDQFFPGLGDLSYSFADLTGTGFRFPMYPTHHSIMDDDGTTLFWPSAWHAELDSILN